jgi:hypothetical protein
MLWHNREFLRREIKAFSKILDMYDEAVSQEDQSRLQALFQGSFDLRKELLARNMRQVKEKFDLGLDGGREVIFLSEVGAVGGHITECEQTDTVVAYGAWLPSSY